MQGGCRGVEGSSLVPILSPFAGGRRAVPALLAAPLLVSQLGGVLVDGDPPVGLCEMPAFTLARGVRGKTTSQGQPGGGGAPAGSSAPGALVSGLGVSSGGSRPERCRGV